MLRRLITLVTIAVLAGPAVADQNDWPTNSVLAGTVRTPDGKPIQWAAVWITGSQGGLTTYNHNGRGFTDADGRFRLAVLVHHEETQIVSITVEAREFVGKDLFFQANEAPRLRPERVTEMAPLTLDRGEVLEGVVDIPLKVSERLRGVDPIDRFQLIEVRGPGYMRRHWIESDNHFEFGVPKGTYTLSVMGEENAALKDVPSGSRGLRIVRTYKPVAADVLASAFDALWADMDRNYSYFELKRVDWKKLRDEYRPKAVAAGTAESFADVLAEMLGPLRDMHVSVLAPHDKMPTFVSPRRHDMNFQAVEDSLEKAVACDNLAYVGYTKADRFAAVVITNQPSANKLNVDKVVKFIQGSHHAPGFIVDLRSAGGGSEPLAQEIARQFCGKDTVYAKSKYRNGPGHRDFTRAFERVLKAVEKPYEKPVVCILGPGCVSSGEGFAQMLACLPQVTTVGSPTRGSSGNPKEFQLLGAPVTVVYSRWVDLMPDGTPIEGRGIIPGVRIEPPEGAFETADPVWERAVEVLRRKTKAAS